MSVEPDKVAAMRQALGGPSGAPGQKAGGCLKIGCLGFVILFLVFVVLSMFGALPGADEETDKNAKPAAEAKSEPSEPSKVEPDKPKTAWRYTSEVDAMTDKETRTACVTSTDEVELKWPYKAVTAELCLRDSPKFGKEAYMALNGDGQILCRSYEPCAITVRFGDKPMQKLSGIGAADGSTNIVFVRDRALVDRALAANPDVTRIEVDYYQAGRQALAFPTAGFAWPKAETPVGK